MSTFRSILGKYETPVAPPEGSHQVYDPSTGTGSLVAAGSSTWTKIEQSVAQASSFLVNHNMLGKDASNAFFAINSITGNLVAPPIHQNIKGLAISEDGVPKDIRSGSTGGLKGALLNIGKIAATNAIGSIANSNLGNKIGAIAGAAGVSPKPWTWRGYVPSSTISSGSLVGTLLGKSSDDDYQSLARSTLIVPHNVMSNGDREFDLNKAAQVGEEDRFPHQEVKDGGKLFSNTSSEWGLINTEQAFKRGLRSGKKSGSKNNAPGIISSPYSQTTEQVSSIEQAEKILSYHNIYVGYRNWQGFSIGTDHIWDVQIRPYHPTSGGSLGYVGSGFLTGYNNGGLSNRDTFTPELPITKIWTWDVKNNKDSKPGPADDRKEDENIINKVKKSLGDKLKDTASKLWNGTSENEEFYKQPDALELNLYEKDFEWDTNTPVISYSLNLGTSTQKSIDMYNGQVNMITGFSYTNLLSLDILDDTNHTFQKYMAKYFNSVVDPTTGATACWEESAFVVQLTVMKPGLEINYQFKFVCVPISYAPQMSGDNEPQAATVKLEMSIIGLIPFLNTTGDSIDNLGDGYGGQYKWQDVILVPYNDNKEKLGEVDGKVGDALSDFKSSKFAKNLFSKFK